MAKTIMHIAEAPGGIERYLVTLLGKMSACKDYEHILVCSDAYDLAKFRGLVTHTEVIGSLHNRISLRDDFRSIREIRKVIRKYRPDAIYCHSSKAGATGRIADIGIRNRRYYNGHGWAFNMQGIGGKKRKLYETVERWLARHTDRIICISEYEKISATAHRICREEKLKVINNGIDFEEYRNLTPRTRAEMDIPEDAYVVGTVGRIAKQKAPDLFVRMAEKVKEQIPEAYFIIVGDDIGDGQLKEEIRAQIDAAGLAGCFRITGWVDDPLDYVSVFDTAVLLSRWEGFGLALPEYMLMEKPIVATRTDAIPYVVGEAGILVEPEDWAKAAEAVVSLRKDTEKRNRLIRDGLERVKLFDVNRTAEEHLRLFSEI